MKVIIVDTSGRGGICHYTYSLCQALSAFLKNVTLLTTKNYELDSYSRNFNIEKILSTHYQKKYRITKGMIYISSLIKILFYVLNKNPDVVHFHQIKIPFIEFWIYKLIKFKNIKLIVTLHDIKPFEYKVITPFLKYIYYTADRIIVHSENSVKILKDYISEKRQKNITVLHHGEYSFLSKNISKKEARNTLGIDSDKKVLLFFGYIRRYKGLDILLESIKILKEKIPDIFLIIAGKDVEGFGKYQKIINELNIKNYLMKKIEYISDDESPVYFSAADIVVLPYKNVYQSGIVFLSYAYSRPVITTNVGGLPDAVENGRSGYLAEPNNPEELAEKIDKIFADPENLDKMGKYGYQMAKDKFSWKQAAQKTYNLYLLSSKKK
ncbi:glycosyltransferase family 4 protein [candidate division KSB1 bacterium]